MSPTPLVAISAIFGPLRTHPFAYPALEVLHIMGIALLLGNLFALEWRVWSRAPWALALPLREFARLAFSLAIAGFGLVALTGLLMFASQASELLANRAFVFKMCLLGLAACNAAWFHGRDSLGKLDGTARLQTLFSALVWLAAVVCGRWIAYV